MTGRLMTEAEIREAGAACVREWRANGWQMSDRVADRVAVILAPVWDLLYPQPADKSDAA